MIPKVIHYCWFGQNKKPKLVRKCIKAEESFAQTIKLVCLTEGGRFQKPIDIRAYVFV